MHNKCAAEIQTAGTNEYSVHESSRDAFRAAKRTANIPMSEQPIQVINSVDRVGRIIPGRTYILENGTVIIQHSAGHVFEDGIIMSAHYNIFGTKMHFFTRKDAYNGKEYNQK